MPKMRCPSCNRFGSEKWGGYCSICAPDNYKNPNNTEHISKSGWVKDRFYNTGSFIPKEYGIVKGKADIVR